MYLNFYLFIVYFFISDLIKNMSRNVLRILKVKLFEQMLNYLFKSVNISITFFFLIK